MYKKPYIGESAGRLFAVSFFSLTVALLFGSGAALAADGGLEVKSFQMTDQVSQTEPEGDVTYFYQISNNSDTPVSDIKITDDKCPNVFYDAVNQDANVDSKLNKGETWSFHCKAAVSAASTSTVTVSGLLDEDPVSAETTSMLRATAPGPAESDTNGSNVGTGGSAGSGTGGGITFDAVPAGMPNTGLGKAKVGKTVTISKKAKSLKKQNASANTLNIPAAGVNAQIEAVGKTANGDMAVPVNAESVGWYSFGAEPGETANAVIAGHLDTYSSANGVFKNLDKLQAGDDVYVTNAQDETSHFTVSGLQVYDAGNAPLKDIFGASDKARLNLITCAGTWDSKSHQYTQRLVVYTNLVD